MGNEQSFGRNRLAGNQSSIDPALRHPDPMQTREEKSRFGEMPDLIKPAKPDGAAAGEFKSTGPVWWLGLNNDQTHGLAAAVATGESLAPLAGPLWPIIAGELAGAIGYIETINYWGGSNGVDINGVAGTMGLIVTPRVGKVYGALIDAARLAVSGRTILDFIIMASSKIPELAAALEIPAAAQVFSLVSSGTPLGWALAGGIGYVADALEPSPDIHGSVMADRNQALEWESFTLATIAPGNQVSLLSHVGLFSAQGGGGQGVYANRTQVQDWETWTLFDNGDGTASLRTIDGHFLTAEEGGGRECQANRTAIGNWEKFYIVNLPNGKIALRTHDQGKFVSVQP